MPHCGIGFQHILEGLLRGAIPERVLVEHAPVEERLRFRRARCLEMHRAELLVVGLPGAVWASETPVTATAATTKDVLVMMLLLVGIKTELGAVIAWSRCVSGSYSPW